MLKYHKRKKTELGRPKALKQGLEQKHSKFTEAQISTIFSLNVFVLIFIQKLSRKKLNPIS